MKLNDNVEKFKFEQMPLTIFYVEKNGSVHGSAFFNISGPHVVNTLEVSYKARRRADIPSSSNNEKVATLKIKTESKSFDVHANSEVIAFTTFKEATDFVKKIIEKKE